MVENYGSDTQHLDVQEIKKLFLLSFDFAEFAVLNYVTNKNKIYRKLKLQLKLK